MMFYLHNWRHEYLSLQQTEKYSMDVTDPVKHGEAKRYNPHKNLSYSPLLYFHNTVFLPHLDIAFPTWTHQATLESKAYGELPFLSISPSSVSYCWDSNWNHKISELES